MKREITITVWEEVAYRLSLKGADQGLFPGRAIEFSDWSLDAASGGARREPADASRVSVLINAVQSP